MTPNPGRQPDETRGKRVRGLLKGGQPFGYSKGAPGWLADRVDWRKGGDNEIAEYEVLR